MIFQEPKKMVLYFSEATVKTALKRDIETQLPFVILTQETEIALIQDVDLDSKQL